MAYVGAAHTAEDEPIYLASRWSDAGRSIRPEIRRRYNIYIFSPLKIDANCLECSRHLRLNIILLS